MRHGMMGVTEPEEPITGYDDLGDIHSGDLQQGDGVSTSQLSRVTVSPFGGDRAHKADQADIASKSGLENFVDNLKGNKNSGGSLGVLFAVIAGLWIIKVLIEKAGEEREFATTRIGLENFTFNGAMAMVFFYIVTVIVSLWPTHGKIMTAIREFVSVAK